MRKSLLCLVAPLLLLVGCATHKPTQPLPASCPKPPTIPALQKLPESVTQGDFLKELEMILLPLPAEQKPSEYSLRPAKKATSGLGVR